MRFFAAALQAVRKYIELPHTLSRERGEKIVWNKGRALTPLGCCVLRGSFSFLPSLCCQQVAKCAPRRLLFPLLFAYTRRLAAIEVFLHALSSCLRNMFLYAGCKFIMQRFLLLSAGNMGQMRVLGAWHPLYTRFIWKLATYHTKIASAAQTENLNRREISHFSICNINSRAQWHVASRYRHLIYELNSPARKQKVLCVRNRSPAGRVYSESTARANSKHFPRNEIHKNSNANTRTAAELNKSLCR